MGASKTSFGRGSTHAEDGGKAGSGLVSVRGGK